MPLFCTTIELVIPMLADTSRASMEANSCSLPPSTMNKGLRIRYSTIQSPIIVAARTHLFALSSFFFPFSLSLPFPFLHDKPTPLYVIKSARRSSPSSFFVLVTGAAGFVDTHTLKCHSKSVLDLDMKLACHLLKHARHRLKVCLPLSFECASVFMVEGNMNDVTLFNKLFGVVPFNHVLHLAAQASVRFWVILVLVYVVSFRVGGQPLYSTCKFTPRVRFPTPLTWIEELRRLGYFLIFSGISLRAFLSCLEERHRSDEISGQSEHSSSSFL
ncbi:hypothetical protein Fmac_005952 [Flemingia macrophylla]|uniref:Uncharacterized protein n=1 Tax=Flemingia macrophylla TaxID=520843 RepID=A0ABD1N9A1_9FABA